MKYIPLTKGKFAAVDDEDFEILSQHKWWVNSSGYAYRTVWLGRNQKPKHVHVPMHRQILNVTDSNILVDHRDGDRLNNQRSNLRLSTKSTNGCNRGVTRKNTTGFKGVTKHSQTKADRWIAQIRVANKNIYLGMFPTPIEAARAYDTAALNHFKEFALINGV